MDAAIIPLPIPDTTPPVTNMYFATSILLFYKKIDAPIWEHRALINSIKINLEFQFINHLKDYHNQEHHHSHHHQEGQDRFLRHHLSDDRADPNDFVPVK